MRLAFGMNCSCGYGNESLETAAVPWEDDLKITLELRDRDATDDGTRISFEQLEAEVWGE